MVLQYKSLKVLYAFFFFLLKGNMSLLIQEGNLLCIIGTSGVPKTFMILAILHVFLSGKCKGPLQALLAALDHFAFTVFAS